MDGETGMAECHAGRLIGPDAGIIRPAIPDPPDHIGDKRPYVSCLPTDRACYSTHRVRRFCETAG